MSAVIDSCNSHGLFDSSPSSCLPLKVLQKSGVLLITCLDGHYPFLAGGKMFLLNSSVSSGFISEEIYRRYHSSHINIS